MDDGKANVISEPMLAGLRAAFDRALADEAVVLLAGRSGMFSAGYDRSLFSRSAESIARSVRAGGELVHQIFSLPYPVVIACTGHAVARERSCCSPPTYASERRASSRSDSTR